MMAMVGVDDSPRRVLLLLVSHRVYPVCHHHHHMGRNYHHHLGEQHCCHKALVSSLLRTDRSSPGAVGLSVSVARSSWSSLVLVAAAVVVVVVVVVPSLDSLATMEG